MVIEYIIFKYAIPNEGFDASKPKFDVELPEYIFPYDEFIYLNIELLIMSRKTVPGILEHVLFELKEKGIENELKVLGKENGFQAQQIILRIKEEGLFLYITKHETRVTYSISEEGKKRKRISKEDLLKKMKGL